MADGDNSTPVNVSTPESLVITDLPGITNTSAFDQSVLDKLLQWMADEGGSDLLIKSSELPYISLQGIWRPVGQRPILPDEIDTILRHIYQQSAIATLQGGVPLDFRYVVRVSRSKRLGFRVNAAPGNAPRADMGIKVTFRAIPSLPPSFDDLGFEDAIRSYSMPSFGLVLISGPTGSGKSTTLASIIRHRIENEPANIQTFESPIEFDFDTIRQKLGVIFQSEVGRHFQSYDEAIASVLRMAPDVILLGEARGKDTIDGLVRAAITGHAVYSTTHTNSVAMTVPRMADEFPRDSRWPMVINIVDALRMCIHQRLVRRPDGGRTAIREYLVFDQDVRTTLFNSGPENYVAETQRLVHSHGRPLMQDVEDKYAQGLIVDQDYERLRVELGSQEH